MSKMERARLYLITPPAIDDLGSFCKIFATALDAGDVGCVQLRLKDKDGAPVRDQHIIDAASALLPIARARDVAFVINDRADLAAQLGADGVHIGQADTPYAQAREQLGDQAIIGVTCHASKDLALHAGELGADYVAFGAFFPSSTKEPPDMASPDILTWWQAVTTVPCVAIGGIKAENAKDLILAGADFLAVSAAVWGHPQGAAAGVATINQAIDAVHQNA